MPFYIANSLSGALGACISMILLYPFDYSRMKQANDISGNGGGIWRVISNTLRIEGFRGVYRGASISFAGVVTFRATYFGIFDSLKDHSSMKTPFRKWILSYWAMMIAFTFSYPFETKRRRIMMTNCQNYKYEGFWDCLQFVYRKEGFLAFFRGGNIMFFHSIAGATILLLYNNLINDIMYPQGAKLLWFLCS